MEKNYQEIKEGLLKLKELFSFLAAAGKEGDWVKAEQLLGEFTQLKERLTIITSSNDFAGTIKNRKKEDIVGLIEIIREVKETSDRAAALISEKRQESLAGLSEWQKIKEILHAYHKTFLPTPRFIQRNI
jgi:ABC-type transporter Mla subunit MlaD